jgi:L-ascorbate oxidase
MKMRILSFLLLVGVAKGKEVTYEWDLTPVIEDVYSPDCMNVKEERRSMFLASESFPGPLIEADEGDTITVRVNNLNDVSSVSIHFHGIHQKGTPYSDGAAFITQCALGPLQSQEYVFEAYPPGTHYWHDHASFHLVDGITGPIIIRPQEPEPFGYDDERVSW